MVFYEPDKRDRDLLPHDPFKAFVAPRPIGWVSTVGPDGRGQPRAVQLLQRRLRQPADGDVLQRRAEGLGDVRASPAASSSGTWPTWDLREAMNQTSADAAARARASSSTPGWRWRRRGSSPRRGSPPRRSRSSARSSQVELRDVDGAPRRTSSTFGQVVGVHVDERHIVDGRFDTAGVKPIARCGYRGDYAVVDVAVRDAPAVTAPEIRSVGRSRVRCAWILH